MDRQQIRDEMKTILAVVDEKFADRSDIADDTTIRDGLGLDSLQVVEILFEVEERLGVKIADDEVRQVRTVGDLITLIEQKKK